MKKTILTLALVAASVAAFAQGKVNFGNDSQHYFVIGTPWSGGAASDSGGGVADPSGNTVSGAQGAIPVSPLPSGWTLYAALYAANGTSGNGLTLATSYPLTAAGWLTTGRMVTHGIAVAGLTGGQADSFDMVVWDVNGVVGSALPNLAAAEAAGAHYFGSSGLFTAIPGTSLSYPSLLPGGPSASTWANANLVVNAVPEPTTFALAGLGAAALLIFRRRK